MRKFVYRICLFLLPLVAITLILDFFVRNQDSLYKAKYEGALHDRDRIEIIILGNSHAHAGVDPEGFDLYAYNLANVAQSLYFDKRITLSLLPHIKKLKYVFISVDYHSLYLSSQGVRDIWSYYGHGVRYPAYKNTQYFLADLSPTLFGYTPRAVLAFLKKKIVHKVRYGRDVIYFDAGTGTNVAAPVVKGFISFEGHQSSAFTAEHYKKRIQAFNEGITNSKEHEEILADLEDFIETLLKANVTPILLSVPTYYEYNRYLDRSVLRNNQKAIDRLCKKYHLRYLDLMDSDMFEKEDFYNGDHLNKKGARKLAGILNNFIRDIEKKTGRRHLARAAG